MRISVGRAWIALIALAAVPLACRGVLGIEEREFDPTLADGGTAGSTPDSGADELSCAFYCDTIMTNCASIAPQYASKDACLGYCSTIPKGALGDMSGDTLGCRLVAAKAPSEAVDCVNAGPGGTGACGTNCGSFCRGALALCPGDFVDMNDCMTQCGALLDCDPYFVDGGTPNNVSIQCRLFHLSSAAVGQPTDAGTTQAQNTHCPHVGGITECKAPPPDAGGVTCSTTIP
jgi:hypothetical protein